jgi:hypothetical protein
VRSIYRLVEFALGIEGYPFANEWPFYVFEAVPMLFAISIFCLWFPPAYVPSNKFGDDVEVRKMERSATNVVNTPVMRLSAPSTHA